MPKSMRKVNEFAIEYEAICQKDPSNPILDGVAATKLRTARAGRSYLFTAAGNYDLGDDPATGNKRYADVKFGARVGLHGHAKGTFEATIKVTDVNGAWRSGFAPPATTGSAPRDRAGGRTRSPSGPCGSTGRCCSPPRPTA